MVKEVGRSTAGIGAPTVRDCDDGVAYHLVITKPVGPLMHRSYELTKREAVIGRSVGCDVAIERDDISRKHALLRRENGAWSLSDLGSTNGTFVDGVGVGTTTLREGARIDVGKVSLAFLPSDSEELCGYIEAFRAKRVDEATGLPNRRSFAESAGVYLARCGKEPREVAVVLVEIDFLERINRAYGRSAGDEVLRGFAARLRDVSSTAQPCRLEGKRFACFLDKTTRADVDRFALTVIDHTSGSPIEAGGCLHQVSCSVGYAMARLSTSVDVEQLVVLAELDLSKSAQLGGGRVAGRDYSSNFPAGKQRKRPTKETADLTAISGVFPRELFQRRLVPGGVVFALCMEDRRVIEARGSGVFYRLDKVLNSAFERARARPPESGAVDDDEDEDYILTGVIDLNNLRPNLEFGQLHGGDVYLVSLRRGSLADAEEVARFVEEEFERLRRAGGLPATRIVCGPAVSIKDKATAIQLAVESLSKRQAVAARDKLLPLPIAWAARAVSVQADPLRAFFELRRLQQAIARWLLSVFVAELARAGLPGKDAPVLGDVLSRNVSEGTWVQLLRRAGERVALMSDEELAFPAIVRIVYPRGLKSPLINDLEAVTATRNKFAHGQEHLALGFVKEWLPKLEAMLEGPLSILENAVPRQVISARFRKGMFEVSYKDLVGDHTVIPPKLYHSNTPVEDGKIMLWSAETNPMLSLDPLVVHGRCPQCALDEVFFLDRIIDGELVYASAREGSHELKDLSGIGKTFEDRQAMKEALTAILAVF